MRLMKSLNKTRVGTILNLLSLICVVLIFDYGKVYHWNTVLIILEIAALVIFTISFVFTYIKSGLWVFIHKPVKKLDERELAVTNISLRYAYGIFTVIILFLLLAFSIMESSVNIVLVISLILFAHILPASIIAWTEKGA